MSLPWQIRLHRAPWAVTQLLLCIMGDKAVWATDFAKEVHFGVWT